MKSCIREQSRRKNYHITCISTIKALKFLSASILFLCWVPFYGKPYTNYILFPDYLYKLVSFFRKSRQQLILHYPNSSWKNALFYRAWCQNCNIMFAFFIKKTWRIYFLQPNSFKNLPVSTIYKWKKKNFLHVVQ